MEKRKKERGGKVLFFLSSRPPVLFISLPCIPFPSFFFLRCLFFPRSCRRVAYPPSAFRSPPPASPSLPFSFRLILSLARSRLASEDARHGYLLACMYKWVGGGSENAGLDHEVSLYSARCVSGGGRGADRSVGDSAWNLAWGLAWLGVAWHGRTG